MVGAHILVVEDEPLIADLLEDSLHELGVDVVGPYYDLDSAAFAAEHRDFDAALIDLVLDANNLALPVADLVARRGLPYAFVSGLPPERLGRHADRPFLSKPFSIEDLRALLAKLIPDPGRGLGARPGRLVG